MIIQFWGYIMFEPFATSYPTLCGFTSGLPGPALKQRQQATIAKVLATVLRFPRDFLVAQKTTLGTSLPLNPSRRPSQRPCQHFGRYSSPPSAILLPSARRFQRRFLMASESNVGQPSARPSPILWPSAGRFPGDFLVASESSVGH